MKTILISGGSGLLGQHLIKFNKKFNIVAPSSMDMNIEDINSVEKQIIESKADIFFHAAAYTRPMIKHDENPQKSIETNIIGTSNVAIACIKHKIKLVFVSTDYVYPGNNGNYSEDAPIKPINKYAWSKMAGECIVRLYDNSLILRACFTERPFNHNKAFTDSYKSYLYADEIAPIILRILEKDSIGILNVGGTRKSVYEFAQESNANVEAIERAEIGNWVPKDTSMNMDKTNKLLLND